MCDYGWQGFIQSGGERVPNHGFIQDFELVGRREQDGSRMIVACESMLTHACVCVPTWGGGGGGGGCGGMPSPPRKTLNLDPLRLQSGTNVSNNILMTHILVSSNM